jgi:hypothetical protein
VDEIRKLKVELPPNDRVETGPVQFNDDWPGFFIRGDNAFAIRLAIAQMLVNPNDPMARVQLRWFMDGLDGCNMNQKLVKEMQKDGREDGTLASSDRSS